MKTREAMNTVLTQARLALVLLILCSCIYPVVVWALGRAFFPRQAEGSLVRRADGTVIGSELIGQQFTSARYFHGRPSAVGWNAALSGGSNLAMTNPELVKRMAASITAASMLDGLATTTIAVDRVFASGSGLDPDVTPGNARQQIARVAKARGLAEAPLRALVERAVEPPLAGLVGPVRVNVLKLNLLLDTVATSSPDAATRGGEAPM